MKIRRNSLAQRLNDLVSLAQSYPLSVKVIMEVLAGKGQAVLLILLSLPFCQPIQIPGFSTPFGIVLAFIGLRIAFGHRAWFPRALLEKEISYRILKQMASFAIKISEKLSFLIFTRWEWMVNNPILQVIYGLIITALSLLLALPLPIPFTNLLAAYPILAFGLGILEDDGVMILIGYLLSLLCFSVFMALVWFGKEGVLALTNKIYSI